MRTVMLGAPGSGKGTQGVALAADARVPQISTGDMLREAVRNATPLGLRVREVMDRGALVDDALVLEVVEERFGRADCATGFVLDGFPRTVPQARGLEEILVRRGWALDHVLCLDVEEDLLIRRLALRRVCPSCGTPYHVESNPPRKEGACDRCGGALVIRDDDREEVVRARMEVYRRQTEPLLRFYEERGLLRKVDGTGAVEQVRARLRAAAGVTVSA